MIKKLNKLIKQLSKSEQQSLYEYIKFQYGVEENMLRDDVLDKVKELICAEFDTKLDITEDTTLYRDLDLDAVDITAFADEIVKAFELETIEFSNIMKWQTVGDIISTIEDTLECALSEPFISGFEPEA